MKNLFKNKLIILSLIFLILITNLSNVFAYTSTDTAGSNHSFSDKIVEYLKSDEYFNNNYTCLGFLWNNSKYYVYCFEKIDGFVLSWGYGTDGSYSARINHFRTNIVTNVVEYQFDTSGNCTYKKGPYKFGPVDTSFCGQIWGTVIASDPLLLANGDIYDFNGNVFFQGPPPIVEEPTTETTQVLAGILDQEKEQVATLQEVLQILPLIIVVVVSFLGLRKALKILVTFLKHS